MKVLVVEDDPGLQSQLKWCFGDAQVFLANDFESASGMLKEHSPQVVTLDLGLPPDPGGVSVGFSILDHIVENFKGIKVIVITGQEDRENAIKAVSCGAYDFFNKPVDSKTLTLVAERAFHLNQIEEENRQLKQGQSSSPLNGLITASENMLSICEMVEKVAPSDLSVLILGESGTGKEVIARAVHDLSAHSEGKFVAINCAAIPENLLESELFGHEKGSFTGATKQKLGKIEVAAGGTLFLDEIGDMPIELQAKMLRFLQERVIERVGGTKEIAVDTRVVCATHQPIQKMIDEQQFREDLYFRLSDITIDLPALRDREDDIVLLAQVFLERFSEQQNKRFKGISKAAEKALLAYECKGNVRELEKIIRRAVIMAEGPILQSADLHIPLPKTIPSGDGLIDEEVDNEDLNLNVIRGRVERKAILQALKRVDGNLSKAAKVLDVTRPTLYSLIERLGISLDT